MKRTYVFLFLALIFSGCTSQPIKTADKIDINKFMGKWYVLGGRFTSFEKDVYNATEIYKLDPDEDNIDIDFKYNKGSFNGQVKSIPQRGEVYNKTTKTHWKIKVFWPLKFSYLIVAVADDYSWTAIGVPDQDYLWIMARDYNNPEATIATVTKKLNEIGYDSTIKVTVPHSH